MRLRVFKLYITIILLWLTQLYIFTHEVFVVLSTGWSCLGQEGLTDTREGEDISLKCRFNGQLPSTVADTQYYWLRTNKHNQDNVAIKATPLEGNYK